MIFLAQTSGDELSGFLQQPFVGPALAMVCFFGILLIVVVGILVYLRRRKALAAQAQIPPPPAYYTDDMPGNDMPDLDSLVSTAGLSAPPPPAPSQPAASAPVRAPRKGAMSISPVDGETTEAVEVMTVLRDLVDGRLIVQMGDKMYQNVAANPEFKERFNKIMRELGQITTRPVTPAPPVEETMEAEQDEAEPATLGELIQPDKTAEPPRVPPPPPIPPSGKMPGDLPSFKLADNPVEKRKRGQKQDIQPVPEVNIAGAIEAYLQYKLHNTPEYQGRSIHIYPAPDGGVSIEVDGRFYDAVGDIEADDVREYIATAIQEWQERH